MESRRPRDIEKILTETDLADRAVRKAVRGAILRHKLLGNPIAVSRDGKVVWIPPEEIEVPPPEEDPSD
ncbi:MAG: hypothetical protein ACOC92_01755 [bacterium]